MVMSSLSDHDSAVKIFNASVRHSESMTADLPFSGFPGGPSGASIMGGIAKLGEMGANSSPNSVQKSWRHCSRRGTHGLASTSRAQVSRIMSLQRGIHRGSVLVEARQTSQRQRLCMPTIAAWHAASWFENSFDPVQSFPRSAKLQRVMRKVYRAKCAAIESGKLDTHEASLVVFHGGYRRSWCYACYCEKAREASAGSRNKLSKLPGSRPYRL